jgi:UDP-N-acetylglucosamine 2-epimerase (non-hydrolysing)
MKNDKSLEDTITQTLNDFGLPFEKLAAWQTQQQSHVIERSDEGATKQSHRTPRKLVLITGHRRENFGQVFINICEANKELAEKYPDVDFVYRIKETLK